MQLSGWPRRWFRARLHYLPTHVHRQPGTACGSYLASLGARGTTVGKGTAGTVPGLGGTYLSSFSRPRLLAFLLRSVGPFMLQACPSTLVTWPDPWPWGHSLQLQRLLVLWPSTSVLLCLLLLFLFSLPFFLLLSSSLPCPVPSPCPSLCVLVPALLPLSVCLVSHALIPLPCLLHLSV